MLFSEKEYIEGLFVQGKIYSTMKEAITILVIIFLNFTMFQYRSDLLHEKRKLISNITNFAYELPNELKNDLRHRKHWKNLKFEWRYILLQIFCPRLSEQTYSQLQFGPVSSKPQFYNIFYNCKAFLKSLIVF